MVFKDFCVLVHWANVASALEGLVYYTSALSFMQINCYLVIEFIFSVFQKTYFC